MNVRIYIINIYLLSRQVQTQALFPRHVLKAVKRLQEGTDALTKASQIEIIDILTCAIHVDIYIYVQEQPAITEYS